MATADEGPPAPRQSPRSLRQSVDSAAAYGLFLVSGSAMFAEAASYTGIDWAVIDTEAGAMSPADVLHQVQALGRADVPTIVRVPQLDRHSIEFALDLGVGGVLVPKIDTPQDAELAARFSRYPPTGSRGVNTIRAGGYYTRSREYFETANEHVVCIVQIESREAVRNVEKIAATDGVDMLFIGANDLAMDLGQPGDVSGPRFDEARAAVLAACAAAGKPAGIFAHSTKLARRYAAEGFRLIAIGNEIKFFVQSAALAVDMLHK